MNAARRRWVYGVARAALPLLIALGYVTENLAPLILAALGALLVPELAHRNVTDDTDEEARHVRDRTP